MGSSSIKINSISIDLAGASNGIDMVKCDHFSIRGFVAEARERDNRKSWPFSKESVSLMDQQSYALPSLLVPKFRWWRCMSCIKDIDVDGTKDCGLHPNSSRTIVIKKKNDENSLTVIDHEKENKTTDFAIEDVNCERSQKDNDMFLKNVHHRSMDASTVIRSKSRKVTSPEQVVGNKRSNVNHHQAVLSSEIAGVLEDSQPKAIKNHKGSSRVLMESDNVSSESVSGLQRRKTRKVRLLSELLSNKTSGGSSSGNVSKEDHQSGSKRDSVRGRKRKSDESNYVSRILCTIGATSENASKSCDSDTESTDSGFDRDPIKGKHRNRRFQVVDEFLPSLPCETSQESINEIDPAAKSALSSPMQSLVNGKDSVTCPLTTQRTEKKLGLAKKKKRNKPVIDHNVKNSTLISFGAGMGEPQSGSSINAVSQSTRDLLDSRLASEGYFRKSVPQLNNDKRSPVISLHLQDNDHVRSKDAQANTGGWLRTGLDVFDFSSSSSDNNNNNNRSSFANFKLRHTPSSTEVPDLSSVQQKDASSADKKGNTVIVQEPKEAPSRKENTLEEQNDDIPMEIVELMAKNQYERCLPDKEEDVSNKETAHKSKNALMIDLNETYDNGISMEEINTSRPQQEQQQQQPLCGSNARKEENFPQHKSHEFFPITQPYVPSSSSPFGMIFPPTQENQGSSIQFSGHNCQWLGNVPTMSNQNPSRVLRACNTCQSVPNQYPEASRPIWPPQGYRRPVSFNMDQPKTPGMLSSNENTWNLNFVSSSTNGKQNSEFSFGCKHAAAAGGNRSIDAFSNESSIPALHLLSLMDPRLRSTTPADHHGNTKFTKRHFPPANQSIAGDSSKTAFSTKQLPFDLYSNKRFAPEKSFPVIPPSSLSFQNAQASWNHHHQEKRKDTFLPPVFPNNYEQRKFQLLGASNSVMLPLKFHMTDKEKRKADNCYNNNNNNNASAWPRTSGSGPPIVCSVNRNPADFTIPEPGNVYMLTGENLKVRKRANFKKKQPSLCKQDALKQSKKPVCPVTKNA